MGIQANIINRPLSYGLAGLFSVALALSYGFSFGNVGNQQTYLPHTLNFINGNFLQADWLVGQTTAYHGQFRWVVGLLGAAGRLDVNMAVANVLLIVLGLYLVYKIVAAAGSEHRFAATALLLLFITMEQTRSVAGSYVFSTGLQPSSLATAGWLGAIYFYLRGKYLAAGILLAIGGLFHVNFLVLGIGLFTMVHASIDIKTWGKRALLQAGPSLIPLALFAPLIFFATAGEGAAVARDIFQRIRAPHHYLPASYLFDFWQWAGWTLTGLGAALALPALPGRNALLRLIGAMAVCVVGATILTTVVFIPAVSQLFVWRLAPFCVLLSQVALATLAVGYVSGCTDAAKSVPPACLAVIALGLGCVAFWYLGSYSLLSKPILTLVMVVALVASAYAAVSRGYISRNGSLWGASTLALLMLAMYLPAQFSLVSRQSFLIENPHRALYDWVKRTPVDTRFMVPLEFGDFRLFAERGIIVDWKSTPVKADELIEWHKRIEAIAGRPVNSVDDAVAGYRSQGISQLRATASRYGAHYIIVDRKRHAAPIDQDAYVFTTPSYGILKAD